MSPSDGPRPSRGEPLPVRLEGFDVELVRGGQAHLQVIAAPGTEVVILDDQLRVVARATETWSGRLATGVYKVRLRTGQDVSEEVVFLEEAARLVFRPAAQPSLGSPVPLANTGLTHEYHQDNAERHSQRIDVPAGRGSQLFVFVRDWTPPGQPPRATGVHPAAGLSVYSAAGPLVCRLEKASAVDRAGDPWAACNLELDPGEYDLEVRLPTGETLRQSVVTSPGWQTHVFLLLAAFGDGEDRFRADLSTGSILVTRIGSFAPGDETLRQAETARLALAHDRRRALAGDLEAALLDTKFDAPMFGLYGAHLLARRLADKPAAERDDRRPRLILGRLRELFGAPHPDVEALAVGLGLGTSHVFHRPPMLRPGWDMVCRATARQAGLIPAGSLADRVSVRLWGPGPWLVWVADAPGLPPLDAPGGLETIGPLPSDGSVACTVSRLLEPVLPPGTERTAASEPPVVWSPPAGPTLERMVESLALPRSRVEASLRALEADQNRLRSLDSPEVRDALDRAARPGEKTVRLGERAVTIPTPFPSPADWRDHWVYFLLIDRFDNPAAGPANAPWDGHHGGFQGGTFDGVRRQLPYLKDLGVGAIWLSPVQRNRASDPFTYHGYGVQHFLRIEPRFASAPGREEDELRALIDEAHARGMYVIFDVVLNHAGDVFEYDGLGASAPWSGAKRPVRWRDSVGRGRSDWPTIEGVPDPLQDALVWPAELHRNAYFRRQGRGGEAGGDFESLKELVTDFAEGGRLPVRDALIRAHQYLIARYDVDGFRIDTLKYVERGFAQAFGNAVREYALSIGKKNFFTFGEVYDNEEKIARFVGRDTADGGDLVGVDAALDFPLFYRLPSVAKGLAAPAEVVEVFAHRKRVQRQILTSHGEAGRYFVTFLDNHDQRARFRFAPGPEPASFDDQVPLGVGLLMTLQGIPCLYYGTEQGLRGVGSDIDVREALWGKPGAFDPAHPLYRAIADLARVRAEQAALRYGRQYFRPLSGDGAHFGVSRFSPGVLAFSRLLNDREVVVVANCDTRNGWAGLVLVDATLHAPGRRFDVLHGTAAPPTGTVEAIPAGVTIDEPDGSRTHGPAAAVRVALGPMALLILGSPGRGV